MHLLFRAFRRTYRLSRWVRRRFTSTGHFVGGLCIASAVVGADTRSTLAYKVTTLCVALLLVALAGARGFRPHLTAERQLSDMATVDEPLRYRVRLTNTGVKAEKGLSVAESLDQSLPTYREFRLAREPGEELRNWFDRRVGYPRWEWLVARQQGARNRPQPLPTIPAGATVELDLELTPLRRGHLRLPALTLFRPDPLGTARATRELPVLDTLLVLPRRYAVPAPDLPGRRNYQAGGEAQAASVGESEEFLSLREYRPGDPLRRLHWRSWAKTGHPVVKELQEEYFVRHALVLDTFAGPEQTSAFEDAVSVAASLVTRMPSRDSLLDLVFAGTAIHWITAERGRNGDARILEMLASIAPIRDRPVSSLKLVLAQRIPLISGCACVLLGWDRERQALVRWLRGQGTTLEVYAVYTGESRPEPGPMADQPSRFHPLPAGRLHQLLLR
jgi:uncharacterized protein (DUF58 family)